jgi:hypothetical protein
MNAHDLTRTSRLEPIPCENDVFSKDFVSHMDPYFTKDVHAGQRGSGGEEQPAPATFLLWSDIF